MGLPCPPPNISLIIINRFSASYGGEPAIATYACIAYMICIIYLVFQGVGDGSQPLISQHYGERDFTRLKSIRRLAYSFAMLLAIVGCVVMYFTRGSLGLLFGASNEVNAEVAKIIPIFLVSMPFVAIVRATTASFYASEKFAAFIRRANYDLVECSHCKDFVRYFSTDFEKLCGQARPIRYAIKGAGK